MLTITLLVVAVCLFYYYAVKPLRYFKNKGVKQGNPAWIFGDFWRTTFKLTSFPDQINSLYQQWPNERYFGIYQFQYPILVVKDSELMKQIGVKDFDYFENHTNVIEETSDPLWAGNLFALQGQRWREMRSILSPAFTSSKMRAMFILMSNCAKNFADFFLKKDEDLVEVELKDIFSRYCNDVIATSAFGLEVNSMEDPANKFYVMGKKTMNFNKQFLQILKFFGFMLFPKVMQYFKIPFFDSEIRNFFYDLVDETIRIREEKGIVRPDMIHLLMEARKGRIKQEDESVIEAGFSVVQEAPSNKNKTITREITNQDIASQAMIFFFGGFETVSFIMCFIGYELAVNLDIQERLRNEVLDTLEGCDGNLTYEALSKMKYMDMVVSETLRKWPAAIALERQCSKPYVIQPAIPGEQPVHIDKGASIWLPVYPLHHDPKHFPDPELFDPERFSDENKSNVNLQVYIPFGMGPRSCIGSRFALLEVKVVYFYLLAKFEIIPTEKTNIPLIIEKSSFGMSSENGFPFALKRVKK